MMEWATGTVKEVTANGLILQVGSFAYAVEGPVNLMSKKADEDLDLWLVLRIKDDVVRLFGFLSKAEKNIFEILIGISGVGPKVSLAIISTVSLQELWGVSSNKDTELLQLVPGIGKRTAEKIAIEMAAKKEKIEHALNGVPLNNAYRPGILDGRGVGLNGKVEALGDSNEKDQVRRDLSSALINLGFKDRDIKSTLMSIEFPVECNSEEFSQLLRQTLRKLHSPNRAKGKKTEKKDLDALF